MADVILAKPPFMSPKGGIKPHKRFTMTATRSGVLFVDYMAENPTATGRAAIVVPEGIIFQSGTAYKALRKMLVNTSLVAMVSLPAGVFNPYRGVKTSILILDKRLHKQLDSVLFVKVGNDGFNLGAQRRAVVNSDLPEATRLLKGWMTAPEKFEGDGVMAQAVERMRLGEKGDFNLSGERYVVTLHRSTAYPLISLDHLCDYVRGVTYATQDKAVSGGICVLRANNIDEKTSQFIFDDIRQVSKHLEFNDTQRLVAGDVLICAASGSANHVGKVALCEENTSFYFGGFIAVLRAKPQGSPSFLFQCLRTTAFRQHLEQSIAGANIHNLKASIVHAFQIPLPSLEVQNQIVAEIEGYQKIIDGARQVLDNYKPHIVVDSAWPIVTLGEACKAILTGPFGTALHESDYVSDGIPVINPKNIVNGEIVKVGAKNIAEATRDKLREFTVRENNIVIGRRGEMGRCAIVIVEMNGWLCGTGCFVIRLKEECDVRFAHIQLSSQKVKLHLEAQAVGVTMMNLNQGILSGVEIPLPDLPTQRAIVAEIKAEQALVNANRELVRRMEAKVKAAIDRVWGAAA